ncbi:hypothetical protein [Rhodoferax sp. GW822-FHT02A01]|uniref:hypothetical protein n=1 Tax=Rhodoferax sp. GW822-FHT02A01 TaxID=3141537 RepID=UPI00315C9744
MTDYFRGAWARTLVSRLRCWKVLLLWIHVCLGRCWLPAVVISVEFGILAYVPQAKEVLFALFEPFAISQTPLFFDPGRTLPTLSFLCVGFALSTTLWYMARLLSTVDRRQSVQPRLTSFGDRRIYLRAVVWVPRWFGTGSLILLSASTLTAGIFPGTQSMLVPIGCAVCPLTIAILGQVLIRRAPRQRMWLFSVAAFCLPVGVWLLLTLGARIGTGQTFVITLLLNLLPALLHLGLIFRRALLRGVFGGSRRLHPAASRDLNDVSGRLLSIAICTAGLLFFVTLTPQLHLLSSPDVVLLFLGACATVGTLISLWFARVVRWTPSIGWVAVFLVTAAVILGVADESLGLERLDPPTMTPFAPEAEAERSPLSDRDVILNAHGGGLRAAYYTASVLARVDELSCGKFGQRLSTASGVSGGSFGIATYLMIRQYRLIQGAWTDCSPSVLNSTVTSQSLVDRVLLNDFLSPVLANLFSVDLLPVQARRGQALLDGWQRAIVDTLGKSGTTFASPLSSLGQSLDANGMNHPGPTVLLNSTVVSTGRRMEFNNHKADACGHLTSIGEAVLHSARFPVISPAGSCQTASGPIQLVDGGYYDNSGAEALTEYVPNVPDTKWLNINGNPPEDECASLDGLPSSPKLSAIAALLASRKGHASEAEDRLKDLVKKSGGSEPVMLTLSLDEAFNRTILDRQQRCAFVRTLRSAPLGWYMTRTTAEAMNTPILSAASKVCQALSPLCGSAKQ